MTTTAPRRISKTIKYFLYRILILILTIISVILLTPLSLLILIPFAVYRKFVIFLAHIFNPSLGKILTTGSSLFAAEEVYSQNSTTISGIHIVKGKPDFEKFREEFIQKALDKRYPKSNELVHPEFRQNVVRWMGYGFWKDVPNFSLSDCLISAEESQKYPHLQGEWSKENIQTRLFPLNTRAWDPEKPLWRMIFLPYNSQNTPTSPESSNDTLVIIMMHHCFADGYSAIKAFLPCMGINPQEFIQKLNKRESKIQHGLNLLTGISYFFTAHYDFLYSSLKSIDNTGWKIDGSTKESQRRAFTASHDPFPLQRLKDVKDKLNVSLSAVVLASLTAGLRRGLLDTVCKETPQGHTKKLPKKIHLVLPLPVPGHPDKLRNHLTFGTLSLPVGDPDPISRVRRVHRAFERLKVSPFLLTAVYLQKISGAFPLCISSRTRRIDVTAILTNLPGPPCALSVSGCPVEDQFCSGNAQLGSMGVAASFTTYNGSARIQLGGFDSVFPNQKIVDDILATTLKEIDVLGSLAEV